MLPKKVDRLAGAQRENEKSELEAANLYAEKQDADREIKSLKKELKAIEKKFEEVAGENFGSAVDAYTTPSLIKKLKPES